MNNINLTKKHNRLGPLEKRSKFGKIVFIVVGLFFFIYAFSYIYVLFFALNTSLKINTEFLSNPLSLPKNWKFINYLTAFKELEYNDVNMLGMIFNSLWFSLGTTFLQVFFPSITAYVVCKYKFVGKNFLYGLAIFIMIIPIVGSLPATYKLYGTLGLIDTPFILLGYCGGFGFNFILFYGFFKSISWSYAEAVFVDGGGHFTVLFKIMMPQAISSYIALGIITFIGNWNDYMTPILYLESMPTLAAGLFSYENLMQYKSNFPVYYAGIIMSMVPIIVLYTCFQETIMKNSVAGGLKG